MLVFLTVRREKKTTRKKGERKEGKDSGRGRKGRGRRGGKDLLTDQFHHYPFIVSSPCRAGMGGIFIKSEFTALDKILLQLASFSFHMKPKEPQLGLLRPEGAGSCPPVLPPHPHRCTLTTGPSVCTLDKMGTDLSQSRHPRGLTSLVPVIPQDCG